MDISLDMAMSWESKKTMENQHNNNSGMVFDEAWASATLNLNLGEIEERETERERQRERGRKRGDSKGERRDRRVKGEKRQGKRSQYTSWFIPWSEAAWGWHTDSSMLRFVFLVGLLLHLLVPTRCQLSPSSLIYTTNWSYRRRSCLMFCCFWS